jgi:GDP/UDP-N,N'-diacetylbacillosamine 2-epimerase (hydrolysing)
LEQSIRFKLDRPYAVVTFHPVTLEENHVKEQFKELLSACDKKDEILYIFTKANADAHGRIINQLIDQYVMVHKNTAAYFSLGMIRYLSALKYCEMVIGNSSSGIIEAPFFGIPTINIGDRQKGRLQSSSVINCNPAEDEIVEAIELAQSTSFKEKAKKTVNPYGNGNTSERIAEILMDFILNNRFSLKKHFFDINFDL